MPAKSLSIDLLCQTVAHLAGGELLIISGAGMQGPTERWGCF